jgi:hypothetical protein
MRNASCGLHLLRLNLDPEARFLFKDTAVKVKQRFEPAGG